MCVEAQRSRAARAAGSGGARVSGGRRGRNDQDDKIKGSRESGRHDQRSGLIGPALRRGPASGRALTEGDLR